MAAEVHGADQGDPSTMTKTASEADEALMRDGIAGGMAEAVADRGYHADEVIETLQTMDLRTCIAEKKQKRGTWRSASRFTSRPPISGSPFGSSSESASHEVFQGRLAALFALFSAQILAFRRFWETQRPLRRHSVAERPLLVVNFSIPFAALHSDPLAPFIHGLLT